MKKENNIIEKFLQNYTAKSTIKSYRSILKRYFLVIEKQPDTYFKTKQDYKDDVLKYWRYLSAAPPKTISASLAGVRMFLSENNHELPAKFWRGIRSRTKGSRAVTDDKIPSPQQMKQILSHADVRGRALFLTMLQSGMRIGEVSQINISDVDLTSTPTKIRIRAEITKTGNQRYCFIGLEATEAMKSWLSHRDTFIHSAASRSIALQRYYHRIPPGADGDERVFPFSISLIRDIWNRLLDNAGLGERDQRTKYRKMHPHVLRKFYRTHMSLTVPVDVVEALMGHEGYLTDAYRRYNIEQLGEKYLEGEKNLAVFESIPDLSGIKESLKEKDDEIKKMEQRLNDLEKFNEYLQIKLDVEKLKNGKK